MPKAVEKEVLSPWANNTHEPSPQESLLDYAYEVPDPTPVAPPVGYKKQPSMVEYIRDMVRSEKLRQEAEAAGYETFEESEDFDVGDDNDPTSPWENEYDPPISEIRSEVERNRKPPSATPGASPGAPPPNPPSDGPGASKPSAAAPAADGKPPGA